MATGIYEINARDTAKYLIMHTGQPQQPNDPTQNVNNVEMRNPGLGKGTQTKSKCKGPGVGTNLECSGNRRKCG